MERVLFNLHQKMCTSAMRRTSNRSRSLAEHVLLVLAVCGFGALLLLHISFVYSGTSTGRIDSSFRNIPIACLPSVPGFVMNADISHVSLIDDGNSSASSGLMDTNCLVAHKHNMTDSCSNRDASRKQKLFSFSRVKGYLLLPDSICEQHDVSVQHVAISKSDVQCFGEPFLQALIFGLVGPDTVILNWLLTLYDGEGFVYNPRTKVLHDLSQHGISLKYDGHDLPYSSKAQDESLSSERSSFVSMIWYKHLFLKFAVVLKTTFLFFITTTLVSFTLRETQERMLDFTHQLQARVRSRRPVVNLVTTHLADSLVFCPVMVGMIFFLIEFYRGDKFLAFMVLSIVWLCEVFSVIRCDSTFVYYLLEKNYLFDVSKRPSFFLCASLRSWQGINFFPKIFFLLFALVHFYIFSFPFGFSHTALGSTVCFMAHSMLFFWHRFELPAVALGHITVENPRMGMIPSSTGSGYRVQPATSVQGSPAPHTNGASLDRITRANNNVTASPAIQLHPRQYQLVRQHSHGTSASIGRMSRQASSTALFHSGEDGDESYMYFMDGEVVMHRAHTPSSTTGSGGYGTFSTTSSPCHDCPLTQQNTGIPDHVLAEVGVGPTMEADYVDNEGALLDFNHGEEDITANTSAYCTSSPARSVMPHRQDDTEPSTLQLILDATPRSDNLSNHGSRHDTDPMCPPHFKHDEAGPPLPHALSDDRLATLAPRRRLLGGATHPKKD